MKKITLVALLAITTLFGGQPQTDSLIQEAIKEAGEITPKAVKTLIDAEKDVIVLDVREERQRAEGEIFATTNLAITRGNLEFEVFNKIKAKERDTLIVTYCRGGSRGALAAQSLKKLGFKNVKNLQGGLKGWAQEGYPVETGLGVTRLDKE